MKIRTTKTKILNALKTTDKAIAARATMPILQNVLLEAKNGIINLTGTNLDIYLHSQFEPSYVDDGELCLPSKKLIQIIGNLPEEIINLEKQKNHVKISSGSSIFQLPIMNSEEYPKQPIVNGQEITIETENLKTLINSTKDSSSTDEGRYVLNSIMLHHQDDKLIAVSTDGRRLCKNAIEGIGNMEETIVPFKSTIPILEILSHGKEAKISHEKTSIFIKVEDEQGLTYSIYSKLIEGKYPNYRQVIPKTSNASIKISKEEFSKIILRSTLITSDKSPSVKLTFNQSSIDIDAKSTEYGNFNEPVTCQNGPEESFQMAINPKFLLSAIKNAPTDEITLEIKDGLSPAIIKSENYLHVIMPLRLN